MWSRGLPLLPLAAMIVIVVASNWLVQFPINDLLTWGAITYPFSFLVTDLTTRLRGPVQAAVFHQVGSLAVLLNALRLLGFEPQPASLAGRLGARLHDGLQAVLGLDLDGFVGWLAQRWRAILRLKLTVIAIWWLSSCLVLVGPDEVGVVRLLGRHWRTYGPGAIRQDPLAGQAA